MLIISILFNIAFIICGVIELMWWSTLITSFIRAAKLEELESLKPYLPDSVYYPRLKQLGGKV